MKVTGGRGGRVTLDLDDAEASLFRSLLSEMEMLLEADIPDNDAVKERLFPRAYQSDDEERNFRDLTAGDLAAAKLDALRQVRDAVGASGAARVKLEPDDIGAWLRLLTDLRLGIGVRLEVTEETMSEGIDPDDPNAPAMSVLHWLGWVQGSILERIEG